MAWEDGKDSFFVIYFELNGVRIYLEDLYVLLPRGVVVRFN